MDEKTIRQKDSFREACQGSGSVLSVSPSLACRQRRWSRILIYLSVVLLAASLILAIYWVYGPPASLEMMG
jgi:hypothetical protein